MYYSLHGPWAKLTPFKMPDNWRSKIGMVAQDVKDDSNRPPRGASPAIHGPVPVYAVCHRCLRAVGLVAKRFF
jgi:hypothetical protein